MIPTLFATVGLPGSGKSTWVLEQVRSDPDAVRVNRDAIRLMMGSQYEERNEVRVLFMANELIKASLAAGYNVYVDETNLQQDRLETLERFARAGYANFKVKSFLDVGVAECIGRDTLRGLRGGALVGEAVIMKMASNITVDPAWMEDRLVNA